MVDINIDPNDEQFFTVLNASNNSNVQGGALVSLGENTLTVNAVVMGLEPGEVHPFHIHGFQDDSPSTLPDLFQDGDQDGFVEDPEGEPVTGGVLLALTTEGPPSDVLLSDDFPVADENGVLEFSRIYEFDLADPTQAEIFGHLSTRLEDRVLQLHGLTLPQEGFGEGTPNEVNGAAGYIAELPVADGLLQAVPLSFDSLDTQAIESRVSDLIGVPFTFDSLDTQAIESRVTDLIGVPFTFDSLDMQAIESRVTDVFAV
ncbi:MAG TPA: hypothetical protein VD978_23840 [Azospirillum sp.]|nr:hypothetical protein [Azospirillum sp.]